MKPEQFWTLLFVAIWNWRYHPRADPRDALSVDEVMDLCDAIIEQVKKRGNIITDLDN